jgi:hypothetical protein
MRMQADMAGLTKHDIPKSLTVAAIQSGKDRSRNK